MIGHFCTGGKMTPSLFKSASLQPLLLKTKGYFNAASSANIPPGRWEPPSGLDTTRNEDAHVSKSPNWDSWKTWLG